MQPAFIILVAYLIGSIPFGYLIVRATQGADVRETGSGGTGATNVSRRAGKAAGVLTLMLDAVKGAVAVVFAKVILSLPIFEGVRNAGSYPPTLGSGNFGQAVSIGRVGSTEDAYWWLTAAAIAVLVGHIFPIWLRFSGGKGVATGIGVFSMLAPYAVAMAILVFLVVVVITRYVSLGSMLAAFAIPVFLLLQHAWIRPIVGLAPTLMAAIAGAALIVFAHRQNIGRLLAGTETKFE